MRYSIEPRDRVYVKGYGFLSFAKNVGKNLSNKYGQKLLDSGKESTTDSIKTASKRAIQKAAGATGWLVAKLLIKLQAFWESPQRTLKKLKSDNSNDELQVPKKAFISLKERQQIIEELGLV